MLCGGLALNILYLLPCNKFRSKVLFKNNFIAFQKDEMRIRQSMRYSNRGWGSWLCRISSSSRRYYSNEGMNYSIGWVVGCKSYVIDWILFCVFCWTDQLLPWDATVADRHWGLQHEVISCRWPPDESRRQHTYKLEWQWVVGKQEQPLKPQTQPNLF